MSVTWKPQDGFVCPSRAGGVHPAFKDTKDYWRKEVNGDRCCSYCGSLSEEDFFDILTHYVAGDPGYKFDPSTKGYKSYANRPGVANASVGGIKFYHDHVNKDHPDFAKRGAVYQAARAKFAGEMAALYPESK